VQRNGETGSGTRPVPKLLGRRTMGDLEKIPTGAGDQTLCQKSFVAIDADSGPISGEPPQWSSNSQPSTSGTGFGTCRSSLHPLDPEHRGLWDEEAESRVASRDPIRSHRHDVQIEALPALQHQGQLAPFVASYAIHQHEP